MTDLTHVEKIEAAITRLEELRASISERDFKLMTYYASGADSGIALLSLILHRTLDAQFAILRSAFGDAIGSHDEPGAFENATQLADAILEGGTE